MNLFDSSFLCLDIGTAVVRGIAHRVRSARIEKSAVFAVESYDTVFAIKSVVDELERQIGTHFDSAFVTGDFGDGVFDMIAKSTQWSGEHKISTADVRAQIAQITPPDGYTPMHVIPLRYDAPTARNMLTPVGHTDRQLISAFGAIFYPLVRLDEIYAFLRRAHIQADGLMDSAFLISAALRPRGKTALLIDLGAAQTTVSIWTDRGPVFFKKIPLGQTQVTQEIAAKLNIDFDDAEKIKRLVASAVTREMDRFTPADTAYDFSRADVNDVVLPMLVDMIAAAKDAVASAIGKYHPSQIILTGGGADIDSIDEFVENAFAIPVTNEHADAAVRSLAAHIWAAQAPRIRAYQARVMRMRTWGDRIGKLFRRRRRVARARFVPVLPSTLAFDMKSPHTYTLFKSGGISMIHVDMMDGFFVNRMAGGIDEIKYIRAHTDAHLHVHLMTEGPAVWAADAAAAGADTIIVSAGTSGVRAALRTIRERGRRCGIAISPDASVSILKPILRDIDEVLIMSVRPGAGGQEFMPSALHKISVLAATRKKYGLKFTITVDGGINPQTARQCWAAGADMVVAGTYLARSADFPLAVQSLMKTE